MQCEAGPGALPARGHPRVGGCEYPLCRPALCLAVEAWVCDWAGRGNTAVRIGPAKECLRLVLKSWEVPWKLWVRGGSLEFGLHVERDAHGLNKQE